MTCSLALLLCGGGGGRTALDSVSAEWKRSSYGTAKKKQKRIITTKKLYPKNQ